MSEEGADAVQFLVLLAIAANIYMTLRILRNRIFEPRQRAAQIAIVWLIPVAGAVFSWFFFAYEPRDEGKGGDGGGHYMCDVA